jgi:hypothetical protein
LRLPAVSVAPSNTKFASNATNVTEVDSKSSVMEEELNLGEEEKKLFEQENQLLHRELESTIDQAR